VVDVPNGTYQVILTAGDAGPYGHDQEVFLEGVSVDTIATAAGEVLTRTYTVTVTDGQLTLRLDGRGGADPNMIINALQVIEIP
jgi:fibronectin type 3 domain-containing protein